MITARKCQFFINYQYILTYIKASYLLQITIKIYSGFLSYLLLTVLEGSGQSGKGNKYHEFLNENVSDGRIINTDSKRMFFFKGNSLA